MHCLHRGMQLLHEGLGAENGFCRLPAKIY